MEPQSKVRTAFAGNARETDIARALTSLGVTRATIGALDRVVRNVKARGLVGPCGTFGTSRERAIGTAELRWTETDALLETETTLRTEVGACVATDRRREQRHQ